MHYGSLYTTTEYTTDTKSLNANLIFTPVSGLMINIGGNYSISTGEFDPVIMPEVPVEVEAEIEAGIYDYSKVHTYSDLSYKHLDGNFKIQYRITPGVSWDGEMIYSKFEDDNGYVFGDESGSIYFIRSGLEYGF